MSDCTCSHKPNISLVTLTLVAAVSCCSFEDFNDGLDMFTGGDEANEDAEELKSAEGAEVEEGQLQVLFESLDSDADGFLQFEDLRPILSEASSQQLRSLVRKLSGGATRIDFNQFRDGFETIANFSRVHDNGDDLNAELAMTSDILAEEAKEHDIKLNLANKTKDVSSFQALKVSLKYHSRNTSAVFIIHLCVGCNGRQS